MIICIIQLYFIIYFTANNIDTSKMQNNDNINSACNIYERCPLCHFCLSNTCFIIPPPHYPLQHKLVMDAMRRKLAHRILCDTCSDEVIVNILPTGNDICRYLIYKTNSFL